MINRLFLKTRVVLEQRLIRKTFKLSLNHEKCINLCMAISLFVMYNQGFLIIIIYAWLPNFQHDADKHDSSLPINQRIPTSLVFLSQVCRTAVISGSPGSDQEGAR